MGHGQQQMGMPIPVAGVKLRADLALPEGFRGVVLFAHGSGSSRQSPRNRYVAQVLNQYRLGTLLTDLLTVDEEKEDAITHHLRFDIALLTERLVGVVDWLAAQTYLQDHAVGCFGASTGAAAALAAAAARPEIVKAVVSRGGRPDLADRNLEAVAAPVLLIVGGNDPAVLDLNRKAMARMSCPTDLKIVPGATHLFVEPGTLEEVARLAAEWFAKHLAQERE